MSFCINHHPLPEESFLTKQETAQIYGYEHKYL